MTQLLFPLTFTAGRIEGAKLGITRFRLAAVMGFERKGPSAQGAGGDEEVAH